MTQPAAGTMADPRRAAAAAVAEALREPKPVSPEESNLAPFADNAVTPPASTLSAASQSQQPRGQLLHLQLGKGTSVPVVLMR